LSRESGGGGVQETLHQVKKGWVLQGAKQQKSWRNLEKKKGRGAEKILTPLGAKGVGRVESSENQKSRKS